MQQVSTSSLLQTRANATNVSWIYTSLSQMQNAKMLLSLGERLCSVFCILLETRLTVRRHLFFVSLQSQDTVLRRRLSGIVLRRYYIPFETCRSFLLFSSFFLFLSQPRHSSTFVVTCSSRDFFLPCWKKEEESNALRGERGPFSVYANRGQFTDATSHAFPFRLIYANPFMQMSR